MSDPLAPDTGYLRAKTRRARQGIAPPRAADPDPRLPPGQKAALDWPVLDLGMHPAIPAEDWMLTIDGLVRHPLQLSWDDISRLPQVSQVSDIHCVTSWSRLDSHFGGVALRDVIEAAGMLPDARFVMLHSADGYTVNLPLEDLLAPGSLLAHSSEEQPLSVQHGGPVRVLVPHLYLWKSAKWISRLELLADDKPGFWEERGYHRRGDPWAEQRYALSDGSFYPAVERPMSPERRADADGVAALAALEAMQQSLGGGTDPRHSGPWWKRLLRR